MGKKCEKVQCKLSPKKTVFKIPWIFKAIFFFLTLRFKFRENSQTLKAPTNDFTKNYQDSLESKSILACGVAVHIPTVIP